MAYVGVGACLMDEILEITLTPRVPITYSVWHYEKRPTLTRQIRRTEDLEEVERVVAAYEGKGEYVFVTYNWDGKNFFLLNSLDGVRSTRDYRRSVAKIAYGH